MILVDTSVWVDHLRKADRDLSTWLELGEVVGHPFVVGELACGNLKNRAVLLDLLNGLPQAAKADDDEVLAYIESTQLAGRGLGLVDIHLLASSALSRVKLWTRDKRLHNVAADVGLVFRPDDPARRQP